MSFPSPQDEFPPPPAYSEADYDRKISTALELSLHTPQPHHHDHDTWEAWDDAAFEAAQAAHKRSPHIEKRTAQGGSSLLASPHPTFHPTEPLKINKKPVVSKPPPSWLENTLDTNVAPHNVPPDNNNDNNHSIHPPPFTSRGPSLDGPPYEPPLSSSRFGNRSSVPPQLASPITPSREDVHPIRTPGRHSLPQIPRTQPQRPTLNHPSHRLPPTPITTFDHSMAYRQDSNPSPFQQHANDYDEQRFDVNLLYNASVVNHLTASPRHAQRNRVVPSQHDMAPAREAYSNRLSHLRPSQAPSPPYFSPYSHHHHHHHHHSEMSPGMGIEPQMASYYARRADG